MMQLDDDDAVVIDPPEHVMPYVAERITRDDPGAKSVEIDVADGDAANELANFLEHVARIIRARGHVELTAK